MSEHSNSCQTKKQIKEGTAKGVFDMKQNDKADDTHFDCKQEELPSPNVIPTNITHHSFNDPKQD